MSRFGAEQEIGVQINRRLQPGCGVNPARNPAGSLAGGKAVHPERSDDVRVTGQVHRTMGHRLHRLFRIAKLPIDTDLIPHIGLGHVGFRW